MQENSHSRLSRRDVFKWFAAAAVAMSADGGVFAVGSGVPNPSGRGYGTDPDLTRDYKPGEIWPLTFDSAQRVTVAALCDLIFPADHLGPSASSVGVPEFIDEWISAPYPVQSADRSVVLEGLVWLDSESNRRFKNGFAALDEAQRQSLCDDISDLDKSPAELKKGARFFSKFRNLCAGGYFSTVPGWKAIGYVGNAPSSTFDGPPPEVLLKVGVEQTVA